MEDRLRFVRRNGTFFDGTPRQVPAGNVDVSGNGRWRIWEFAGTKIDAPIFGNGDLLCAFAGPTEYPQIWITTNDFWQMESNPNWEFFHDNAQAKYDPAVALGSPRPVGRMVFDIPALREAGFSAWQSFEDATTCARYTLPDGETFEIKMWVAAGENIVVAEFQSDFDADIDVEFRFPDEIGKGCDVGVDFEGTGETDVPLNGTFVGLLGGKPLQVVKKRGGVIYGYREFSDRVDVPTKVAFAGRFLGEDSVKVRIRAGERLVYALPVRSWAKTSRPLEYARSRAAYITAGDIGALRAEHCLWWKDFWGTSGVELDDPVLEKFYYLSQYMLASLSRDPDYPPNIQGISTFDRMAWNGNYKINYNHQSPYLGLLAAGHFEQSDPHDAPYLAMLDIGREMSRRLLGHEGVYLPLGLGPVGMVSEPLLLYMKSPAVHGALNMMIRYNLTLDRAYAKRVYPFLRSVAEFWAQDLVKKDGKYRIVADGMHERTTDYINKFGVPENPTNTLGYLRTFFKDMIAMSEDLSVDEEKRPLWADILNNLSPYRVGTIASIRENPSVWNEGTMTIAEAVPEKFHHVPVYFNEETNSCWSMNFPGNIMHIYPGGAIGLDSPEEERRTALNTIDALSAMEHRLTSLREDPSTTGDAEVYLYGAWNSHNLSCLFFPAAVRVGYDPDVIWAELRDRLEKRGMANGFIEHNPQALENLSVVPNTIQEMMMLSHEGVIRLFRVWPRAAHPNASFFGLRAYGAFVVNAALKGGAVADVLIESGTDRVLRLENPWPGSRAILLREDGRTEPLLGGVFEIPMRRGERIKVDRE